MNARDPREEFDAVPFSECRTPFTPGDRVYQVRRPESGSLIVERCEPYGDEWSVTACDERSGLAVMAPADYFRACGPNWVEPPDQPEIAFDGIDLAGARYETSRDDTVER